MPEKNYTFYPLLLNLITHGNSVELSVQFDKTFFAYFGQLFTSVKYARELFLINLGFTTHAATEGGLMPEMASLLCQKYQVKLAPLNSTSDIITLMAEMMTDYAREVNKTGLEQINSLPVNKCISYIRFHVYEQINLNTLARSAGCSTAHLQRCFKQFTGSTITAYIRKTKMQKACFFLEHTSLACVEIAQRLTFCSQSYFIEQFKREFGMTPMMYRNYKERLP